MGFKKVFWAIIIFVGMIIMNLWKLLLICIVMYVGYKVYKAFRNQTEDSHWH